MSDERTRALMVELRRALLTALRAIDAYLAGTARRPERAQRRYGADGEEGYISEIDAQR